MSRHRRRRAYRQRACWWRNLHTARVLRATYEAHCQRVFAPEIFRLACQMMRCEQAFIRALGGRAGPVPEVRAGSYGPAGEKATVVVAW